MRRKAKKSKLFLILILVLGISVGYAALSKTLKINGNCWLCSTIKNIKN